MTSLRSVANLFALASAILLLSSCQQYRFDVTYEKCNGMTGSIILTGNIDQAPKWYNWRDTAVPIIYQYLNMRPVVVNVCDFSYTRTPITK